MKLGVLDFAGGNVVHINAGMSGLAAIFVVGNRMGFGVERFDPHNILSTFTGMAMLWVGWFGFNGGSAFKVNNIAGNAILATQICTSTSALMWMLTEWSIRKRPSILGMINGSIAGLVLITPGCGFVNMTGAFFIGK
jgi:Amt family ammonium transporter